LRDLPNEAERRRQVERVRAETNARIADILTPAQRPAWQRLLAESGGRGGAVAGRVYILEDGAPTPVNVRLGLTDGSSTEVLGDGLTEGVQVVVGVADAGRAQPAAAPSGGLPRGRFF
jgi:HlyD family secretion protein